jgi:PHP family Zn ribbon phosphoesterase
VSSARSKQTKWYRMDLHLHTPGSLDYQEPNVTYLDILRKAELRGLDIIAFTDHNSVRGYAEMMREIEQLEFLNHLGRAEPDEIRRLNEYHRLLDKILLLPGFEFTATFGFHILGIFSPQTPIRKLEHILLSLRVPADAMDEGNPAIGASSDVLTAYRLINEAGGLVIAAHVNSANGVAMRGFDFGGQTKIAYTQDPYLYALEVTDLEKRSRMTTARFFDGSKPEYPRRMRCIQGSDAHRLNADPRSMGKNLGIGDRITEIALSERSFSAMLQVFRSTDFASTRPYRSTRDPYDHIQAAREEGPSIVQSFHEFMAKRNGYMYNIVADVGAMANTNGGTIYIGVSDNPKKKPVGVERIAQEIEHLYDEIDAKISPKLEVEIDAQESQGIPIVRIRVPRGPDVPYAIDENKIYVRDETETTLAVRDEIVQLVQRAMLSSMPNFTTMQLGSTAPILSSNDPLSASGVSPTVSVLPHDTQEMLPVEATVEGTPTPLTGVEIVSTEERNGKFYHTMHDLRNGSVVRNVTRASARRLWHYAITEHENQTFDPRTVQWHGDVGLIKRYERGSEVRYDLAQRQNGQTRIYYGVTDEGLHGAWLAFADRDDEGHE